MYQAIAWEGHLNYLNNKICRTILFLPATLGLAIYPSVPVPSSRCPLVLLSRNTVAAITGHVASAGAFQGAHGEEKLLCSAGPRLHHL